MVKPRALYRKNGLLLGEMLRQGYTIESLARAIGVHYLTVWRLVNREHRPHADTAGAIARLLAKSPHELGLEVWGGKGQPPPGPATPESPPSAADPDPAPPEERAANQEAPTGSYSLR